MKPLVPHCEFVEQATGLHCAWSQSWLAEQVWIKSSCTLQELK
jgi:hypothetical protein